MKAMSDGPSKNPCHILKFNWSEKLKTWLISISLFLHLHRDWERNKNISLSHNEFLWASTHDLLHFIKIMPLNQLYFNFKSFFLMIKNYATDIPFDEDTMLMISLSQRVDFESSYKIVTNYN